MITMNLGNCKYGLVQFVMIDMQDVYLRSLFYLYGVHNLSNMLTMYAHCTYVIIKRKFQIDRAQKSLIFQPYKVHSRVQCFGQNFKVMLTLFVILRLVYIESSYKERIFFRYHFSHTRLFMN